MDEEKQSKEGIRVDQRGNFKRHNGTARVGRSRDLIQGARAFASKDEERESLETWSKERITPC
jgi:hypothetical protein